MSSDDKKKRKMKGKMKEEEDGGVCYFTWGENLSTMGANQLQAILSRHGKILKHYVRPESDKDRKLRQEKIIHAFPGRMFTEGWVVFAEKSVAKKVALVLNGHTVGGKKTSHCYDDVWDIKYLSKVKCSDFGTDVEQNLRLVISAAEKEKGCDLSEFDQSQALNSREEGLTKEHMLYEQEAKNVWFIRANFGGQIGEKYVTGFSITETNILTTALYPDWDKAITIVGRRLDETGFPNKLKVVKSEPAFHLTKLVISQGRNNKSVVVFAEKASLKRNDKIWGISNVEEIDGWILIGNVGSRCEDTDDTPWLSAKFKCESHNPKNYINPSDFRVIGDIYNNTQGSVSRKRFVKNLHPFLPVIQCTHFMWNSNLYGGPVYNEGMKVVGMLCVSESPHVMALNVSVIHSFV